jgi:hypothetical protein
MNRCQPVGVVGVMVFALGVVWAQDSATPPSDSQTPQQPIPAYGQENAPPPISENPPLSGLDLPSLQEHAAPLSYLQPGATFSESGITNIGNGLGGNTFGSISRGIGTLALRRLWSHYDLALDYMGGAAYYQESGLGWRQLQDLGVDQKIQWKRGQLSLRDSFSYLPEGNFGAAYGSLGSVGVASMGNTAFGSFWGGSGLGALGLTPRILNVSLAELSENLNPKSALTAAGGYAFTHFYGNDANGSAFIGSSQVSAQGGYNRILTSHTQIAAVYGYQGFDFSVSGAAFHSHVVQGMYGHRISGRLDLLLGAGPQLTFIDTRSAACSDPIIPPQFCLANGDTLTPVTVRSKRVSVAAQARLRYRISRNSFDLRYERSETSGAGLFSGAQTDVIRLGLEHPLSRIWSVSADLGYSRNERLQPLTPQQLQACFNTQTSQNACPAGDARTYMYGFAGAALHRYFGREFHGFVTYQFNELLFDHSFCVPGTPCSRISNRQAVTLGLDWTPRPIRID